MITYYRDVTYAFEKLLLCDVRI